MVAAAGCLAASELISSLILLRDHRKHHPVNRTRWRARAARVVARRGAVAGLTRFTRVTLYGLDILLLGWWASHEVGPYAAGRRLVFSAVAIGLVIPSTLAPAIARAWAAGVEPARRAVASAMDVTWFIALPTTLALVLTGDRLMPGLFGPDFREGGPYLTLIALRLPWLLAGSFAQAALVACRREGDALRVVAAQSLAALAAVPAGALLFGFRGVGSRS